MVSLSNAFETGWNKLVYQNDATDAVIVAIGAGSGLRASTTAGSLYVALHNLTGGVSIGEASNQATNETAYGSYARQAVARSAAGWAVSTDQVSNVADILFPLASGGSDTITHWSIGPTNVGATPIIDYGAFTNEPKVFTAAVSDTITCYGHGLVANDQVVFFTTVGGTALPTGITESITYYVRGTGITTDTFTVSTTPGGAAVDLTTNGAGFVAKCTPLPIVTGVQPKIPAGTLIIRRS